MARVISDLPEYLEVNIGSSSFDLESESLVVSMTHQFINKSNVFANIENYDLLFEVTKDELLEYLFHKIELGEKSFNLFGDWQEDFKIFHSKRNEPFCRDIVFNFTDGSEWAIKIIEIATLRVPENSEHIINFSDPILLDDKKLLKWVQSLKWEDVKELAEEMKRPQPEPDYEAEWKKAKKTIKKWDNDLTILDFYDMDDKIRFEGNPDDKSISDH